MKSIIWLMTCAHLIFSDNKFMDSQKNEKATLSIIDGDKIDDTIMNQGAIKEHNFVESGSTVEATTTNSVLTQCVNFTTTTKYSTYCKFFLYDSSGNTITTAKTSAISSNTSGSFTSIQTLSTTQSLSSLYLAVALVDSDILADNTIGFTLAPLTSSMPCLGFPLSEVGNLSVNTATSSSTSNWGSAVTGQDGSQGWYQRTFAVTSTTCSKMATDGSLSNVGQVTVRLYLNDASSSTTSTTSTSSTSSSVVVNSLTDQLNNINYVYVDASGNPITT